MYTFFVDGLVVDLSEFGAEFDGFFGLDAELLETVDDGLSVTSVFLS